MTTAKQIISAEAHSVRQATTVAQAMEDLNCSVFSIILEVGNPYRYTIWGKFDPSEISESKIRDKVDEIVYGPFDL